jgi:hypothetical protein
MLTAAPAVPMQVQNLSLLMDAIRDPNVAPEKVRDDIRAAIVDVRDKLTGAFAEDHRLIDQSLDIRDAALECIDTRVDTLRLLASAEIALMQFGLGEEKAPDVDKIAMHAANDAFRKVRAEHRATLVASLGEVADAVIELQRMLDHAYEHGAIVTVGKSADTSEVFDRIWKFITTKAGRPDVCDPTLVKDFLLKGDLTAFAAIEKALQGNPHKGTILELMKDARPLFEDASLSGSARFLRLGSVFMKAATATKVVGLKAEGWYKDAVSKAAAAEGGMGATVDLNTDTGVRVIVNVGADQKTTALMWDVPKQYGATTTGQAVEKILHGEETRASREYPDSAPIYAHMYEVGEVVAAFKAMPEGARCSCAVMMNNQTAVPAILVKKGDAFVYEADVPGAPPAADVYANPGLNMLPWSLRFLINGTHAPAAPTL